MKRSELEKQKAVVLPLGDSTTYTYFEDAAGHRYEFDRANDKWRIIRHSVTGIEEVWNDFEDEGQGHNSNFTTPGAGIIGATDVGARNMVGGDNILVPKDAGTPARAPGSSDGDPELEAAEAKPEDMGKSQQQLKDEQATKGQGTPGPSGSGKGPVGPGEAQQSLTDEQLEQATRPDTTASKYEDVKY